MESNQRTKEHFFSENLAYHTSSKKALILKKIYEELRSNSFRYKGMNWISFTAKSLHDYFPYITTSTIRKILISLDDEYWIVSSCINSDPLDQSKSYTLFTQRYESIVYHNVAIPIETCKNWSFNIRFLLGEKDSPINPHDKYPINWNGFPNSRRKRIKGVYMIGNKLYVGASINIRKRIIDHCCRAMGQYVGPFIYSDNLLLNYIQKRFINEQPIDVYYLSDNPYDERKFIEALEPKANSIKGRTYDELF